MSKNNTKYDVIIIGAGIGGLVCGCYLAKARKRVLIVEKHHSVGGYCISFSRSGYVFDAGIHYLGSLRQGAQLNRVFNELQIFSEIELVRSNPTNIVKTYNKEICFSTSLDDTINNLSRYFPKEQKNIISFLKYLTNSSIVQLYQDLKGLTLENLLGSNFQDCELKDLFCIFAYNLGLLANNASAVAMAVLYKEFILDGGYYPIGGMGALSNAYAKKFKEYGGTLLLSHKVTKILMNSKYAIGVRLISGDIIQANYIVANCDLKELFSELLNEDRECIDRMECSVSAFLLCLGLNKKIDKIFRNCGCFWYFPERNIQTILPKALYGQLEENNEHFILSSPSFRDPALAPKQHESVIVTVLVPYKTEEYWKQNRSNFEKQVISRVKKIIPDIEEMIVIKENACPSTLRNYTLNNKGAICGWASTLEQVESLRVSQQIYGVKNLFLAGHWASSLAGYGGLAQVTHSGWKAAKLVLCMEKEK